MQSETPRRSLQLALQSLNAVRASRLASLAPQHEGAWESFATTASTPFVNRRRFLSGGIGCAIGAMLPRFGQSATSDLPPPANPGHGGAVTLDLVAAERPTALPCFGGKSLPLWTLSDRAWPPVVRLKLGERLDATFTNDLQDKEEHSSIHWHGIRLPNDQDGVPYLTQRPVWPGEKFAYSFVPPDTGTFFFHPHCDTAQQLGRGMAGLLIVEGDESEPYDADVPIVFRDWRLDEAGGGFLPFFTPEGAGKAGTFGAIRSANGEIDAEIFLPAGGDCRLRLLNLDNTRVMEVGIEDAEAAIVAVDGIALPPEPLKSWRLGPAMRIDVAVRAPADGKTVRMVDYFAPEPVPLARLTGRGETRRADAFDPPPLRAGRIPAPDMNSAERLTFAFSATASADAIAEAEAQGLLLDSLCASAGTFWAINKNVWPGGDHSRIPAPLATLTRGKSYVFELQNLTPHQHPIHIHGHSFKFLKSNKRDLPVHHADTVLLQARERVEVAFVADNPGDWMLHCHIIEHQESGMMGYIRVA
jgi:FtsP/CotA-like multicopper oxidase with cupredoxin domain